MVLWAHEESTAFGSGTAASRIVAGDLKAGDLDQVWNGLRRADGIRRIGGDPDADRDGGARAGRLARATSSCTSSRAARSIRRSVPIGIVEGIVAIHRYDVVVEGFANHAGTTPMDERQDAMLAASQLVLAVREIASRAPGPPGRHRRAASRSTPNSPNVDSRPGRR